MNLQHFVIPEVRGFPRINMVMLEVSIRISFHGHQMEQFKHHDESTYKGLNHITYVKVIIIIEILSLISIEGFQSSETF